MASSSKNKDLELTNEQKDYRDLKCELIGDYFSYKVVEKEIKELQEELSSIDGRVGDRLKRMRKICRHPINFVKYVTRRVEHECCDSSYYTNERHCYCLLCRQSYEFESHFIDKTPLEFPKDDGGVLDKDFLEWLCKTSNEKFMLN
jgi:hypothetical protein